jgi:hypothetical protein
MGDVEVERIGGCTVVRNSVVAMAVFLHVTACTEPTDQRLESRSPSADRVFASGQFEWHARVRRMERILPNGLRVDPLAIRAGGGLLAVLHDSPLTTTELMLWEAARAGSLHVAASPSQTTEFRGFGSDPALGKPADVVNVSEDGIAWFLDSDRLRITSQDVGGMRKVIGYIRPPSPVRRACALTDSLIAYLRDDDIGGVYIYDLLPGSGVRRFEIPRQLLDTATVAWADVRLAGSRGGPCVAFAGHMPGLAIITDEEVRAVAAFVEPAAPKPSRLSRLWSTRRGDSIEVLDATSVPGAVAVLWAGPSDSAGRLVDFYSLRGSYMRTMVLPRRALRIAGAPHRLYVLAQYNDSAVVASWVLPSAIRQAAPPSPPAVLAPRPPV